MSDGKIFILILAAAIATMLLSRMKEGLTSASGGGVIAAQIGGHDATAEQDVVIGINSHTIDPVVNGKVQTKCQSVTKRNAGYTRIPDYFTLYTAKGIVSTSNIGAA